MIHELNILITVEHSFRHRALQEFSALKSPETQFFDCSPLILRLQFTLYVRLAMYCNQVMRRMARQILSIPTCNSARALSDATETTKIEKSLNQVTLLGRVGADPQKRGTSDRPVVTFSLATHTNYKYESGEFMQRTDWHRIAVFKPILRDTVYSYLKKGNRVLVNGRLSYGEIKDEDGNARLTTSIIADDVIFFQTYSS